MMNEEDMLNEFEDESKKILLNLCKLHPNFSLDNVVSILPKLIIHTNDLKNLDTDEKKLYINNMIKYVIKNTDGPGDDEKWDPILISLIPSTVDILLNVSNGTIKLNDKKKKIRQLLNCCKKKN